MNPDIERFPILRAFGFAHLPPHLAAISEPFFALAHKVAREAPTPDSPGLRHRPPFASSWRATGPPCPGPGGP
jgi:hypothetical protein